MKKALEIIGEVLSSPTSHQQALQALRDVRDALIYPCDTGKALPCQVGDYGHIGPREMATVFYDDHRIAECYTSEQADFIAAAINHFETVT